MSYDHKTCLPKKAKVEPKKGPRGGSRTIYLPLFREPRGTWFALVEKIRCHIHIGQICMFSLALADVTRNYWPLSVPIISIQPARIRVGLSVFESFVPRTSTLARGRDYKSGFCQCLHPLEHRKVRRTCSRGNPAPAAA